MLSLTTRTSTQRSSSATLWLAAMGVLLVLAALVFAPSAKASYGFVKKWGAAGSGNGQLQNPGGIDVDSSGNVYVADYGNNRIQKFDANGSYITQWGSAGSGIGQFNGPTSIAVSSTGTNVYVTDYGNNRIEKFSSTGMYLNQWGTAGSGNGQFNGPADIAVDGNNNVYVTDYFNSRVQKFTATGTYVTQFGSAGSGNGKFNGVEGIAIDSSNSIFVTDSGNDRVQQFSPAGSYQDQWGVTGSGDGQFNGPSSIAIDSSGSIFVTDYGNSRVQQFSGSTYKAQWGGAGSGNGQFNGPAGVAANPNGNIYVTDRSNSRIQVFGPFTYSPGFLSFGNQKINKPSATKQVKIDNSGVSSITLPQVALGGIDSSQFTKSNDGCSNQSVAAGASCTVDIAFTPTATGAKSASLNVVGLGDKTNLTGTGIDYTLTSSLSFGDQKVGTTSTTKQIQVKNTGVTSITVPQLTASGDVNHFPLSSDNCSSQSLASGSTCTIDVNFVPTSVGSKAATVTIGTEKTDLTGTSIDYTIIGISHFSQWKINSTSSVQQVQVKNTGVTSIVIPQVVLGGVDPSQFTKSGDNCSNQMLAAGDACMVGVAFTPTTVGSKTATFNVGSVSINIAGVGIDYTLTGSLSFSNQQIGTASVTQQVQLKNTGGVNINLLEATLGGADSSQFSKSNDACVDANGNLILAAGATCTIGIKFTPTTVGNKTAALTVGAEHTNLTGTGIDLSKLSPALLIFSDREMNTESVPQQVKIQNSGVTSVSLPEALLGGPDSSQFTKSNDTCSSQILAPSAICTVDVKFTPTTAGLSGATLDIAGIITQLSGKGLGIPPAAVTNGASLVSNSAVILTGSVNPGGLSTAYNFEYGKTTSYGSATASKNVSSGNLSVGITENVANLEPGATYHYRAVATNAVGTAYGSDQTFTLAGVSQLGSGGQQGTGNQQSSLGGVSPVKKCKVPKLVGKNLVKAKKLLKAAKCKLGQIKVKKAARRIKRSKLVVVTQAPKAGKSIAINGAVKVTLGKRKK